MQKKKNYLRVDTHLHLSPVIAVVIVNVDAVSAKKNDIGRAAGFVSSFFFVTEVQ